MAIPKYIIFLVTFSIISSQVFGQKKEKYTEKIGGYFCPKCHKHSQVIRIVYAYPSKRLIQQDKKGKIKLQGCDITNCSPKRYCKRDKISF